MTTNVRQLIRQGDVEKLDDLVLEGQGHKLIGESASDSRVRAFLKTVPSYVVSKYHSG